MYFLATVPSQNQMKPRSMELSQAERHPHIQEWFVGTLYDKTVSVTGTVRGPPELRLMVILAV
jgi:hypothetical protein